MNRNLTMTRFAVTMVALLLGFAPAPGRAQAAGGTDTELASALALLTTLPTDESEARELMGLLLPGERYGSCEDPCLVLIDPHSDNDERQNLAQYRRDRQVRLQVVYSLLALNAERAFPVLLRLLDENAGHVDSGCPGPSGPPSDIRGPAGYFGADQDHLPLIWRWGNGGCASWESKDEKIVVTLRILRVLQLMRPGKSGQSEFRRTVEKIALRLYYPDLPCQNPVAWIPTDKANKGSGLLFLAVTGSLMTCPDELVIRIALRIEKGW
ncbi:MAG: hypothetical protein ABIG68_02295 [Acidobacteriota bacterium]